MRGEVEDYVGRDSLDTAVELAVIKRQQIRGGASGHAIALSYTRLESAGVWERSSLRYSRS